MSFTNDLQKMSLQSVLAMYVSTVKELKSDKIHDLSRAEDMPVPTSMTGIFACSSK